MDSNGGKTGLPTWKITTATESEVQTFIEIADIKLKEINGNGQHP